MKKTNGFTLLEMLLSMAILLTVIALASQGIISIMKINRTQSAAAAAQAKLRSSTEALEQFLRGSTLGGLAAVPYTSGPNSISFANLTGSAGLQITGISNSQATVVASDLELSDFSSKQALVVASDGTAFAVNVTSVADAGSGRYNINYDTCNAAATASTSNAKLHAATIHGFSYDNTTNELSYQVNGATEVPVAFDISKFDLEYVYINDNNTWDRSVLTDPSVSGVPQKTIGSRTLRAVNILMESTIDVGSKDIKRSYSSLVQLGDLGDTTSTTHSSLFTALKGIQSCS